MSSLILTRAEIESLTREEAESYLEKVLGFGKIHADLIQPGHENLSTPEAAAKVFELLTLLQGESNALECNLKDPSSPGIAYVRERATALAFILGSAILREYPHLHWGIGWEPPKRRYLFQNFPVIKGIQTAHGDMDMAIFSLMESFSFSALSGELDQAKFAKFIASWISRITGK